MREKQSPAQKIPVSLDKVEEKAAFLARHSIFRELNNEEINELDRLTTAITCPSGRILYRPGEASSVLFFIKIGRIQLYHLSTDGRKLVIATLTGGDCFGEMSIIRQNVQTSFAEAIEETLMYTLGKYDSEHLLKNKPGMAYALLQMAEERLAQLEAQLVDTTFKSTTVRLALLLLQLAQGQEEEEKVPVVAGLSHEGLADQLGVYRETVSTALRELKDAGAIELGRKHITICSPALLAEMAAATKR